VQWWNNVAQRLSAIEIEYSRVVPVSWAVQSSSDLLKRDETNQVPVKARPFLLITIQSTSIPRRELNAAFEEFPSVRCYQQITQ